MNHKDTFAEDYDDKTLLNMTIIYKHAFCTWVMFRQSGQRLGRVHTNIVLGEDDLSIQHGP